MSKGKWRMSTSKCFLFAKSLIDVYVQKYWLLREINMKRSKIFKKNQTEQRGWLPALAGTSQTYKKIHHMATSCCQLFDYVQDVQFKCFFFVFLFFTKKLKEKKNVCVHNRKELNLTEIKWWPSRKWKKHRKDKAILGKKRWRREKGWVRREELHANEIWMSWWEAEPAVFVSRLSHD